MQSKRRHLTTRLLIHSVAFAAAFTFLTAGPAVRADGFAVPGNGPPLQQGLRAWDQGRAAEAVHWFTRHIASAEDRDGADDSVFFLRGLAQLSLGNLRQAADDFREALTLMDLADRTTRAEILNQIGIVHSQLGEHEVAVRAFSRAVSVQPNWEIYSNRAEARWVLNNPSGAIEDLKLAIDLRPAPDLYIRRAGFLREAGRTTEARADLNLARLSGASMEQLTEINARLRALNNGN